MNPYTIAGIVFFLNAFGIILRTVSIKVVANDDMKRSMITALFQASMSATGAVLSINLVIDEPIIAGVTLFMSAMAGRYLGILINKRWKYEKEET